MTPRRTRRSRHRMATLLGIGVSVLTSSRLFAQAAAPVATTTEPTPTSPPELPATLEAPEPEGKKSKVTSETDTSGTPLPEAATLVPPKLKTGANPVYPDRAQQEGISAVVVLALDIGVDGKVMAASVATPAQPSGYGFDEAALQAAQRLEFEPGREADQPVTTRILFRFKFVPSQEEHAPAAAKPEMARPRVPEQSDVAKVASGQLGGQLLERGTRLPLAGIKVTVFRGSGDSAEGFETESDGEGRFSFFELPAGEWRLLADPDGYYPLRATEDVAVKTRTEVNYYIERVAYNPYDVVVDAKRVRREVSQIRIDAGQAERMPGTFGDVLSVVQNFPGVARATGFGFSPGVVIRGSNPLDSRILVSGIEVPAISHFGGLRSVLPVGMLDEINFYPANFSVQYGRATGGIIDVGLKRLRPKKVGGYADISILDSSLYLEAPLGAKLSVALAARRSYIDVLAGMFTSDGGDGAINLPRYYDMQALASYRPAPAHELRTFLFMSDDRFEAVFEEPEVVDANTTIDELGVGLKFHRGILEYDYIPSDRFSNALRVSFGRDHNTGIIGESNLDERVFQGQLRDTTTFQLAKSLTLRGGIDYLFSRTEGQGDIPTLTREGDPTQDVSITDSRRADLYDHRHSVGAFVETELRPYQGLLVLPGVRLDYFTFTDIAYVLPRITARHTIGDKWTAKGGIGLFSQEPNNFLYDTNPVLGNPNLTLEKAIHYSAGIEYRPKQHLLLDVTGFYKTMFDQLSRTTAVTERAGELVPLNLDNGGKGRVFGAEFSFRHELTDKLFAWAAYTLSRSERRDSGGSAYRLFDRDQTHNLTLIASYRLPRNWEVSARFRYVSGNPYTPVLDSVFNSDTDTYNPVYGATNSRRLPAFHQGDVRVDKRWIFETFMLNAYLDIQNVYDRENSDDLSYNYDYTDTRTGTGVPLLPVVGLRGTF